MRKNEASGQEDVSVSGYPAVLWGGPHDGAEVILLDLPDELVLHATRLVEREPDEVDEQGRLPVRYLIDEESQVTSPRYIMSGYQYGGGGAD